MMKYSEYFIKQDCPVCNSAKAKVLHKNIIHTCKVLQKAGVQIKNEDALSDVIICLQCGHKYLSIILKDEIIDHYYNAVNSEYYDSVKLNPRDKRAYDTKKFANLIANECPGAKTVLEIGSGMGYLLYQLKDKGFDCFGVEPSEFASSFSRDQLGLHVITDLLNTGTFENRKFDIIIMSDVAEHVSNINGLFAVAGHYLADNGRIIILTGNSNSLYARFCGRKWLYYFSWEHLSFFNKPSITRLFDHYSLQLEYFKQTQHTGSFWVNMKIVLVTLLSMVRNFTGIRKENYYYMAFDHFIAIGKKQKTND